MFTRIALLCCTAIVAFPQLAHAKIEFPAHFKYGVPGSQITAEGQTGTVDADGYLTLCCYEYGGESRDKDYHFEIHKPGYVSRYDTFRFVTQNSVGVNAKLISECEYSTETYYHYDSNFTVGLPADADGDGISANCDCDDNDASNKNFNGSNPHWPGECPEKIEGTQLSDPINDSIEAIAQCADTDIGNDPYFKGQVFEQHAKVPIEDRCIGSQVEQYDCVDGYATITSTDTCPYDCSNGACQAAPEEPAVADAPSEETEFERDCTPYGQCIGMVMLMLPSGTCDMVSAEGVNACLSEHWNTFARCHGEHPECAQDVQTALTIVSASPEVPAAAEEEESDPSSAPSDETVKPEVVPQVPGQTTTPVQPADPVTGGGDLCGDLALAFDLDRSQCEAFVEKPQVITTHLPEWCRAAIRQGADDPYCTALQQSEDTPDALCSAYIGAGLQLMEAKDRCLAGCDPSPWPDENSSQQPCTICLNNYRSSVEQHKDLALSRGVGADCVEAMTPIVDYTSALQQTTITGFSVQAGSSEEADQNTPLLHRNHIREWGIEPETVSLSETPGLDLWDVIDTQQSTVTIEMGPRHSITLDPNTRIAVGNLIINERINAQRWILQQGRLLYSSDDEGETTVVTDDGSVRSTHTEYAVHNGEVTTVKVFAGVVDVYDTSGQQSVRVGPGELTTVKIGEAPQPPSVWDEALHAAAPSPAVAEEATPVRSTGRAIAIMLCIGFITICGFLMNPLYRKTLLQEIKHKEN